MLAPYHVTKLWYLSRRERTFEGQKEKHRRQDQQHTEREREYGNIDLKRERWQRVLHLTEKEKGLNLKLKEAHCRTAKMVTNKATTLLALRTSLRP